MATTLQEQPVQTVEDEYTSAASEDDIPETKASVTVNPNPAASTARFSKNQVVQKPVFANGERTKGVFTIYASRYNSAKGYYEYQLRDFYTTQMTSGWTREKELKPGS